MRTSLCILLLCSLSAGCASIEFSQLTPDLTKKASDTGLVYYMPKPYLLVMALPDVTSGSPPQAARPESMRALQDRAGADLAAIAQDERDMASKDVPTQGKGQTALAVHAYDYSQTWAAVQDLAAKGPSGAPAGGSGAPAADAQTPSDTGGDTSFSAQSATYFAKIIYLPDLSRPMSIKVSNFLASQELKPTLQDGWMLTGLDAPTDNTAVLTALISAAGAVASKTPSAGTGSGAAAAKGKSKTLDLGLPKPGVATPSSILRPGLYCFDYDPTTGLLTALRPVVFFTSAGLVASDETTHAPLSGPGCHA